MRRIVYLITAGITFVALLFSGFAVFAPVPADAPTSEAAFKLPEGRGVASGRLASLSFAVVASNVQQAREAIAPDPIMLGALDQIAIGNEGRQSTTTTTTSTSSSTTTSTTTPPTTTSTTTPTTTTSTATTSTTVPPTTTTTVPVTTTTTTLTTTTTTPPSSGPLTENQMRELAARFFPAEEVETAVLVAKCESGYNPNAYNPAGPYGGLFQHLESAWDSRAAAAGYPEASIFDAEANTAAAAWLWNVSGGWGPWGCRP